MATGRRPQPAGRPERERQSQELGGSQYLLAEASAAQVHQQRLGHWERGLAISVSHDWVGHILLHIHF